MFTTSFHDFPFQYRIYTKENFSLDFPFVIRRISFMFIYFMRGATFMNVISLLERTLCEIHIHFFLSLLLLLLLLGLGTSAYYTSYSIWHLPSMGQFFFLIQLQFGDSVFLFLLRFFFQLPLLINVEMLGIQL